MRKIVVALVVALLALTLAGCGGGGNEPAANTQPVAAPAPAPVASTEPTYAADRSSNDSDLPPAAFPSFTATTTPAVFKEKLDAKRPMFIFFYDNGQQVTADARAEVDAVMADYRGLIDLVTFDVGEPKDSNDAAAKAAMQAAVLYARELGATNTPYILVVDKGGFIVWRCKGFAERGIIERQVERATR